VHGYDFDLTSGLPRRSDFSVKVYPVRVSGTPSKWIWRDVARRRRRPLARRGDGRPQSVAISGE